MEGPHHFGSAILLVRNPYDTLVADWQRIRTFDVFNDISHTATLKLDSFGKPKMRYDILKLS